LLSLSTRKFTSVLEMSLLRRRKIKATAITVH
jgi:hypothetical protein